MTATFLVKLDIIDAAEADSIADDLLDSLAADGFEVISVEPWARPTVDIGGEDQGTLPLF